MSSSVLKMNMAQPKCYLISTEDGIAKKKICYEAMCLPKGTCLRPRINRGF